MGVNEITRRRSLIAGFAVVCFLALTASCAGNQPVPATQPVFGTENPPTVTEEAAPSQTSTDTEAATKTSTAVITIDPAHPMGCQRPYTDDSIWNTQIDWSIARIHPDNHLMMTAFFAGSDWIGSDTSQYAPPIYYVTNNTPLAQVVMIENSFRDASNDVDIRYGQPGGTVWVPVPEGARPSPGTDSQLAIVNTDSGEEWGMIYGRVGGDGNWTAGGVYRYHIRNSGVPPKGFAQRGVGIGQLAGIVRPCEVERGSIDHAMTLAYDYPCAPIVCAANGWSPQIPPFTQTDGKGIAGFDIPEGGRIVIRPEIPEDANREACQGVRGCIVFAKAMQNYGAFIVDNGGHPKVFAEGDFTAKWDPAVWSSKMLRHIPSEWYAVLDWDTPFAPASD
jgi:hypothetical protein